MADKVTTTSSSSKKAESSTEKVERLQSELREALIDAGRDPGTVDAQMYALRLPVDAVVGNFADLQRMGIQMDKGGSIEEAFVTPDVPPAPEEG